MTPKSFHEIAEDHRATSPVDRPTPSRSVTAMSPEQIVAEISLLRESMTTQAQRINELSRTLYSQKRRTASDGTTAAYIAYTNGWQRFSGALIQGLKRTGGIDRLLVRAKQAEVERQEREAAARVAAERKERKALRASSEAGLGDLIEIYGEEMVRDASR